MVCIQCGATLRPQARFCNVCGTVQTPATTEAETEADGQAADSAGKQKRPPRIPRHRDNEADAQEDANSNGVKLGSLQYEGLVPLGNRAIQTAHQNRIRRPLSTSVGGVFDAIGLVENQNAMRLVGRDGTKVYLSFLQRVDTLNDVFYGLELHRSDGNPNTTPSRPPTSPAAGSVIQNGAAASRNRIPTVKAPAASSPACPSEIWPA